jgi:hypothetical protein
MIIVMLALAIGANTAIYSVAKAVVLTPLPFRDPDRVSWSARRQDPRRLPMRYGAPSSR